MVKRGSIWKVNTNHRGEHAEEESVSKMPEKKVTEKKELWKIKETDKIELKN